jgi:UDP-sugar pyrophosphorylase
MFSYHNALCHVKPTSISSNAGDTHARTLKLLEENGYFGTAPGQITIVKQELVPALMDAAARFAPNDKDPYEIQTKPHGHGDVHTLLHQSGLVSRWHSQGRKWVVFFQVT